MGVQVEPNCVQCLLQKVAPHGGSLKLSLNAAASIGQGTDGHQPLHNLYEGLEPSGAFP